MRVIWREVIVEAKRRQAKDEAMKHHFHLLFMRTIEKISFICEVLNRYFAILVKKRSVFLFGFKMSVGKISEMELYACIEKLVP